MTGPASESVVARHDDVRTLIVTTVVAAVLATGLMVLVHELVHLLTGLALGIGGTLYSYGVAHDAGATAVQTGIMAIAAPIFSLATGLVMARWRPFDARGGFVHLLWLLFAFASAMEGIGYLVITPMGAGDTAVAVASFGWPWWTSLVLCGIGVGMQFWLAWLYAPHVGRVAGADRPRRLAFALWAWLIATVVNVGLVTLTVSTARMTLSDGEATAIVAASTALLVFSPMALIYGRRADAAEHRPLGLPRVPIAGLIAVVVLIGVNQALNFGLHIG